MFEQIIKNNMLIIFAFCIYYILNSDKPSSINKKMILCYLFVIIVRVLNVLDLKYAMIIFGTITFVYLEFIIDDNFKMKVFRNYLHKIVDYFFLMLFKFKLLYFLLLLFLLSHTYQSIIANYYIFNISNWIIVVVILPYLLSKVSDSDFNLHSYDTIRKKLDEHIYYGEFSNQRLEGIKREILLYHEDRTFFKREDKYTLLCKYYFKYQIGLLETSYISFIKKGNKMKRFVFYFKKILKKTLNLLNMFLKYILEGKPLRGFSTIEMQLLRTTAICEGYHSKPRTRKIFELIYTPIFFKGLKNYFRRNYKIVSNEYFRNYILAEYIYFAPIFVNGKMFNNMLELWDVKTVKNLSNEQFFLSVLGLCGKLHFDNEANEYFISCHLFEIRQFSLDKTVLKKLLKELHIKIS